jgi:hypothetical protein
MPTKFWLESLKGRDHSEDLGVGERIILKLVVMRVWAGFNWGPVAGSCVHGNESLAYIKAVN